MANNDDEINKIPASMNDSLNVDKSELLGVMMDTANSLIIGLDKRARLLIFNSECEKVTGYTAKEVIGKIWMDTFLLENIKGPASENFAEWVIKNPKEIYEGTIITKSGDIRTIFWSNSVIYSKNSEDFMALAVGQDITDRKKTDELLQSIINAATESIFLIDRDYNIVMINDIAAERMGETAEKLIGACGNDYQFKDLSKDVINARVEWITKVFETGKSLRIEDDLREGRIFDVNHLPIIDADGNVARVVIFARDITERKKAEEALRESERKFRELTDMLPQTVFEMNMEGYLTYTNRFGFKSTGYTQQDIDNGLISLDLFVEEDRPRIIENREKILKGGKLTANEYNMRRKNGSVFPVLIYSRPIMQNNVPIGLRGIVIDITDRKLAENVQEKAQAELEQRVKKRTAELEIANKKLKKHMEEIKRAEEALRKSEVNYRGLFENILEGVYQSQPDGKILSANPALFKMLGYNSSDELCQAALAQELYVNPEDRKILTEKLNKDGVLLNVEFKLRRKDGIEITVLENARAIYDKNGDISHYEGVLTDITERKRAEKRLKLLSSIAKQSIEGMALIDFEGNLQYTNEAFAEMHGYKPDELYGKNLSIFHTEEQMPSVDAANLQIRETGSFIGEIWHVRKDGTVFPSLMHNSLLRDDTGIPIGMIGIMLDITDRKNAETELLAVLERLDTTLNALPDLMFEMDVDGRIIDFRAPQPELLYQSPEYFLGKRMNECVPKDVADVIDQSVKKASRIGRSQGAVYSLEMRGKMFWFELSVAATANLKNPDAKFIALVRDITERKQAEIALRESEEKHRSLFEDVDSPIIYLYTNGEIVMLNSIAAKRLDGAPKDFIGKSLFELLPDEAEKAKKMINRVLKSGKGSNYESLIKLAAGSFWFNFNYQPVRDANGDIYAIQIVSQDISEQKKAKNQLQKTTAELKAEHKALKEKNIAFKEVLSHLEEEKQDYQIKIHRDIEKAIKEILSKIKEESISLQKEDIESFENRFKEILSRESDTFREGYAKLTPREIEICKLIKEGISSKKISDQLHLSLVTIHKHREHIRNKLGLTNRNINLSSYLRNQG